MTNLTLSPALGWPLGTAICVIMLVCAVAQIVLHIRRRSQSDETVWGLQQDDRGLCAGGHHGIDAKHRLVHEQPCD